MNRYLLLCLLGFLINSCAYRKDVWYMQDADNYPATEVKYASTVLQPNDVLHIQVSDLVPDMAEPYNAQNQQGGAMNPQMIALSGYLVSENLTINFPVLGTLSVAGQTATSLSEYIKNILEQGEHLKSPSVLVRLVNAKFTVLGEVNSPGTYTFTEQNINLLQALGYASDLTINGRREDIILIRELEGVRRITRIDLTNTAYLDGEFNTIKPNDVIVVNQNEPRVKSAGFISNPAALLGVASILISTAILLTR